MAGSVTVSLDLAHLRARLDAGKERCGEILAQQIIDDCNNGFTPFDQGTLKSSARPEKFDGEWAATWNTVYAAYQYYGCWPDGSHQIQHHDRSKNASATTQWCEAAKAQYGSDWLEVAQREFVKGAGG